MTLDRFLLQTLEGKECLQYFNKIKVPVTLFEVNNGTDKSCVNLMTSRLKEGIGKLLNVYKLKGKFDETSVVALLARS